MMNPAIRVNITGIDAALNRVDGFHEAYLRTARQVLDTWGEETVARMQDGHPPGGPHPPPGVMPVFGQHAYLDQTGRLTRSIGHTVEQWAGRNITLTVFATMPYAELVEYGTPRSRPYPFFWPVIWERFPLLETQLAAAVHAAFAMSSER